MDDLPFKYRNPHIDNPHKHVRLKAPGGKTVEIDEGIASLIQALWTAGIKTAYCCEGYPVADINPKAWNDIWIRRAYIAFKDVSDVRRFVTQLDLSDNPVVMMAAASGANGGFLDLPRGGYTPMEYVQSMDEFFGKLPVAARPKPLRKWTWDWKLCGAYANIGYSNGKPRIRFNTGTSSVHFPHEHIAAITTAAYRMPKKKKGGSGKKPPYSLTNLQGLG